MAERRILKLQFHGLFPRCEYFFRWALGQFYEIDSSGSPDLLLVGDFGETLVRSPKTKLIYYTGENLRPDFSQVDFAITFDRLDDARHYRLPLYIVEYYARWAEFKVIPSWDFIIQPRMDAAKALRSKAKFCNFIVSNPNCEFRDDFFRALCHFKKVDSVGAHLNNMNWNLPKDPAVFFGAKLEFQKHYKFSIAFENSSYPGYLTEKIMDPFLVGSIPIYWGDPLAHLDFNPKSFINAASFKTTDELISWIAKVDQHDELFLRYLSEPPLHNNQMTGPWDLKNLFEFFERI